MQNLPPQLHHRPSCPPASSLPPAAIAPADSPAPFTPGPGPIRSAIDHLGHARLSLLKALECLHASESQFNSADLLRQHQLLMTDLERSLTRASAVHGSLEYYLTRP